MESHNVSVGVENGELISVNGSGRYKKGDSVTINFTFDETSYELANVSCTNITCDKNQTISFTMPDNDVNIVVELKQKLVLKSFAEDSWETIAANVSSDVYKVGDEKEVEIDGTSYTVRVANNSTPDECNGTDFSQTACGFVVEFVDVVEQRAMNSTNTNVGGWESSEMRTYANGDFFNKLPSDLQKVIIDTEVISGYGSKDTDNFTTTDKIYSLSGHEVWNGDGKYLSTGDTAYSNTRQLDYYKQGDVTVDNHLKNAIKVDNDMPSYWWLRAACSIHDDAFWSVDVSGNYANTDARSTLGFAPAFRI